MQINSIIMLTVGIAVGAIVIANVLPTPLNTLGNTTLTDSSANALWGLLPLLFVVAIVAFVIYGYTKSA